jgi:hypothetical protein
MGRQSGAQLPLLEELLMAEKTSEEPALGRWRTDLQGRTLYLDDKVVGMLDTEELARAVVERMSARESAEVDREKAKRGHEIEARMKAEERVSQLESQLAEVRERDEVHRDSADITLALTARIDGLEKELAAEREKTASALPLLRHLRSSIDKKLAWAAPLERGITGELLAECEVAFGVTPPVPAVAETAEKPRTLCAGLDSHCSRMPGHMGDCRIGWNDPYSCENCCRRLHFGEHFDSLHLCPTCVSASGVPVAKKDPSPKTKTCACSKLEQIGELPWTCVSCGLTITKSTPWHDWGAAPQDGVSKCAACGVTKCWGHTYLNGPWCYCFGRADPPPASAPVERLTREELASLKECAVGTFAVYGVEAPKLRKLLAAAERDLAQFERDQVFAFNTVSFPALPIDAEDERLVDEMMAQREGKARKIE